MIVLYKSGSAEYAHKNDPIEYFKNGKSLKSEDGNIELSEFKSLIKSELRKFMSPFDNIVLLLGAGASVVGDRDPKYGHTVDMLGGEISEALKSRGFFSLDQLSNKCKYYKYDEKDSNGNRLFNLEDFLSRMQSYLEFIKDGDKNKKKYDASYNKIIEIIKNKTSYDYNSEVFKHGTIIKLLSDMLTAPNRLSIVTTNYDTVIEDSANTLNYTVFDGFTFSHTPTFDVEMFDWLLAKPIPNIKTQKPEYKKSVINLLKIHGSLTWEKHEDSIVRKDKLAVNSPIMVFPNSNKYMQSYERPYFELFSKFQELLRVPNTVLITSGFSFADNHISKMITQAIKNVPSLSVVITDFNISPEDPNGNWKELVDLMNKGYRISFVQATMNGDLSEYFQGGDFND